MSGAGVTQEGALAPSSPPDASSIHEQSAGAFQAISHKFTGADWHLNLPCPSDRANVWL